MCVGQDRHELVIKEKQKQCTAKVNHDGKCNPQHGQVLYLFYREIAQQAV